MPVNNLTVPGFIASARGLLGKPFIHQGRGASGVDCIGLLGAAALGCGVDIAEILGIEDSRNYARQPSEELLKVARAVFVPAARPIAGSLLLFQLPGARYPHHFAIYTESRTIIHAESVRAKCVVEQTYGKPWTRWLHSVWLIPGVEYI